MESEQAREITASATIPQRKSRKGGRKKKPSTEGSVEMKAAAMNAPTEGNTDLSSTSKRNQTRRRRRPKVNQNNGTENVVEAGEGMKAPEKLIGTESKSKKSEKKSQNKLSFKNRAEVDKSEDSSKTIDEVSSKQYRQKKKGKAEHKSRTGEVGGALAKGKALSKIVTGEEGKGPAKPKGNENNIKRSEKRGKHKKSPKKKQEANKGGSDDDKAVEDNEGTLGQMPENGKSSKNARRKNKTPQKRNQETKAASKAQNSSTSRKKLYKEYLSIEEALKLYNECKLSRGKLRCLPGNKLAFVACDRGDFSVDIVIMCEKDRNRALDGDIVFVEIVEDDGVDKDSAAAGFTDADVDVCDTDFDNVETHLEDLVIDDENSASSEYEDISDYEIQNQLWNPVIDFRQRKKSLSTSTSMVQIQKQGRVVHVIAQNDATEIRTIIGRLVLGKHNDDIVLLAPVDRKLPVFLSVDFKASRKFKNTCKGSSSNESCPPLLYKANYKSGSWDLHHRFPPCTNVEEIGESYDPEGETQALLLENNIDYTDQFSDDVMEDVYNAVGAEQKHSDANSWAPTPEQCEGRRDFRQHRIFTIDPTTAKDLDDALHIRQINNHQVEIGVHIADVTHFCEMDTYVDQEARKRATTVYLVDRTIPMLPRPLCEIACSLNENVDRLAFSCVWVMNMDGTLATADGSRECAVWYGKSVIRSCARLDYFTAQNIIENKVAAVPGVGHVEEKYWEKSRQPTGGHSIDEVAADVRLMHEVAMARRALRFENGALALNGIKLTFRLNQETTTPELCEPYPIKDSNRLVEEYMLLANYLVAERLITHSGGRALLRNHSPPLENGLGDVVEGAKVQGFEIDASNSQTLQMSLNRLGRECQDELIMQTITSMLTTPMKPAEYIAAGELTQEAWRHFALNIPYYTHFTSPIRRYADVIVHRLLQATLEGEEAVEQFPWEQGTIHEIASHCNERRMGSKKAQERSDRVFLSLYLRANPIEQTLAVVIGVGEKTFTVLVPSLGLNQSVFLEDHEHLEANIVEKGKIIVLRPKHSLSDGKETSETSASCYWDKLNIQVFAKIAVSCECKARPPVDVAVRVVGPYTERSCR